jgi:acetyl-CoA carboxylase biotin carboxyl carrier protein
LTFKEILQLIEKVAESGISSIEIERAGTKVRIEGKSSRPHVIHSMVSEGETHRSLPAPSAAPALREHPVPQAAEGKDEEAGLHVITAPPVGTFYRSPNPESEAFVNVGDRITKGKVLCIVEAMKLMNEIESDVDGVLVKIYPQNGQPIEYGEKLFAVRT